MLLFLLFSASLVQSERAVSKGHRVLVSGFGLRDVPVIIVDVYVGQDSTWMALQDFKLTCVPPPLFPINSLRLPSPVLCFLSIPHVNGQAQHYIAGEFERA